MTPDPPDLPALDRQLARRDGGPAREMSLRDYFAAQAISGVIVRNREGDDLADAAYQIADALIAARET